MHRLHAHAAILSTGDEVVLGQIQDTNARWLAQHLLDLGVSPREHAAVPDDLDVLAATIERLARAHPLLIMTGGLGPTDGDLTRAALCRVLGCASVLDEGAEAAIKAMMAARGRTYSDRQARQAQRPAMATCLPNAVGTAPGLHARVAGCCDVFCLPGPPGELRPMFASHVVPLLRPAPGRRVGTRLVHAIGVPEADAVARLGDATRRDANPLIGVTASGGVLTFRIRFEGEADAAVVRRMLDEAEAKVRTALGAAVFATGEGTLQSAVLDRLRARGRTLATVESCTGGLLGALLTGVPGSSDAYVCGWITYSNEAKSRDVGVPADTLACHGAVSVQTAEAMARGGLARSGAHHALAITGIAGPGGAAPGKPVGTVCIAHAWRADDGLVHADARRFQIPGDREDVRTRSARLALALAYHAVREERGFPVAPPQLWQSPT